MAEDAAFSPDELSQVVAGLSRRVRLLEEGRGRPGSVSPGARPSFISQAAGEGWKDWARRNGWSLLYLFIAAVDVFGALYFKDWMLGVAAVTMLVFAWLSYDSTLA